jgi:small subunit ribosomal protein S1
MPENNIVNPNADVQEVPLQSEESTATPNPPVEQGPVPGQDPTNDQIPDVESVSAAEDHFQSEQALVEQHAPQKEEPPAPPPAHDDFDWSIDKRNVSVYTKEERIKYDNVYDNTFVAITDGELVKGLVVALTKTDVVINIGFKSDGLVSLNEFRDTQGLKTVMKWK